MAPFSAPRVILSGLKERVESLTIQGDRLYIGTALGNIHIYTITNSSDDDGQQAELVEVKKGLSRRAIDQLGFVQDINSLVVLADSTVTLYPLPSFAPPTPLTKTKGAWCFAIFSGVELEEIRSSTSSQDASATPRQGVPVMVTILLIGCKRRVVWYSWRDGDAQEVQEAPLPHSPRSATFLNSDTICFGYTPTDFVLFSLKARTTTEVTTPVPTATSSGSLGGMSRGALSGLSGYMTLGLGAKVLKPCLLKVTDKEFFLTRDNNGLFIGEDAKLSRTGSIDWPAPPEEIALVKPYIFSIFPPGSVPTAQIEGTAAPVGNPSFIPTAVVEIRSSISLTPSQTLPLPFVSPPPEAPPAAANQTVRLMTSSPSSKSPLYLLTTPTDRTTANTEGSSIWQFCMKPWGEQIDELVEGEAYSDTLALLETIDAALLPDKENRQRLVRALHAVSQFHNGQFATAMNEFIDLNINPAKVVALFPESISGRLYVPPEEWIPLFGGPRKQTTDNSEGGAHVENAIEGPGDVNVASTSPPPRPPSPQGSVRGLLRSGLESVIAAAKKDDDTASIRSISKRKEAGQANDFKRSIEELMRYLPDRRPKIAAALGTFNITNARSHEMPPLSAASNEDLFSLPDAPLSSLTPEQLVRFAQIIDTALFKAYLIVRPGMLAPLCRVGNWCEVEQVEGMLREREKFSELIYLYNGKKMHREALNLLRHLSEKETDMRDKLMPSVSYLQRLGPENLDQIFESAHWIFEQDADIAFEIFTSEEVELPRQQVADYLEMISPAICARYVEFLITDKGEESPTFHDRLAELYLRMTMSAKKTGDAELQQKMYTRFLSFIDTTRYYRPDRLFGLLPGEDLYEAKAILFGRLGRHDGALEVYAYRLHDYLKAEEYCKKVYIPTGPTSSVYLTLLRIYLRPNPQFVSPGNDYLRPALELISRHSPRLDPVETLKLLPPLATAQDVKAFLVEALRAPVFDRKVIRDIGKARQDDVERKLMVLQAKRVKVTDSRICPQCHKRLGGSVIAVHAPAGEVTHYQCREAFSKKLKEMRGR